MNRPYIGAESLQPHMYTQPHPDSRVRLEFDLIKLALDKYSTMSTPIISDTHIFDPSKKKLRACALCGKVAGVDVRVLMACGGVRAISFHPEIIHVESFYAASSAN